jgi:hypothetical protein
MQTYPFLTLAIVLISFVAMGCNEESSNDFPNANLIMEPDEAWIFNNETGVENPDITFNATESSDPDGEIRNYHYEYGEGNFTDLPGNTHTRTYTVPGYFRPKLTVSDNDGDTDSVTQTLTVNYRYFRGTQPLGDATGTADEREHPFPISEFHAFSGIVTVEIQSTGIETPNANVTVMNEAGDVVAFEQEDTINGNVTIVINLQKQDFEQYEHGEWNVVVACENGSITYDATIEIIYKD